MSLAERVAQRYVSAYGDDSRWRALEDYDSDEAPQAVREAMKLLIAMVPRRVQSMLERPDIEDGKARVNITTKASKEYDADFILYVRVEHGGWDPYLRLEVEYEMSVGRWHDDSIETDTQEFGEKYRPDGEGWAKDVVKKLAPKLKRALQQFERELGDGRP